MRNSFVLCDCVESPGLTIKAGLINFFSKVALGKNTVDDGDMHKGVTQTIFFFIFHSVKFCSFTAYH